jgi:hypothetical protein
VTSIRRQHKDWDPHTRGNSSYQCAAAQGWKIEVEDESRWNLFSDETDDLSAIAGVGYHLDPVYLLEQPSKDRSNRRRAIGHDDCHWAAQ